MLMASGGRARCCKPTIEKDGRYLGLELDNILE